MPPTLQSLLADGTGRHATALSRFNETLTERPFAGAVGAFLGHEVDVEADGRAGNAPGAWSHSILARRLEHTGGLDAMPAIGCGVPRFGLVARAATVGRGLAGPSRAASTISGGRTIDITGLASTHTGDDLGEMSGAVDTASLEPGALLRAIDTLGGEN